MMITLAPTQSTRLAPGYDGHGQIGLSPDPGQDQSDTHRPRFASDRGSVARHTLALRMSAIIAVCAAPVAAQSTAATVSMHVDGDSVLRTIEPGMVLGGNIGVWLTPQMLAAPTDRYLAERGAGIVRYPGGGMASNFCWTTMSVRNGGVWEHWSWGTDVDRYLVTLRDIGARPLYSLNPFDHTLAGEPHDAVVEARDLVAHLVASGFTAAHYEIGNEHDQCCPSLSVEEYVDRFVTFASVVKDVDPSARILGPVTSQPNADWREGFLDGLARRRRLDLLDAFSFHYYGAWLASWNDDAIDLALPQVMAAEIAAVRAKLADVGAAHIGIAITEYNAALWDDVNRGAYSIEQALWLADAAGELFRSADIANVWIDVSGQHPHSLLSNSTTPVTRSRNYWPLALVARVFARDGRSTRVAVLETRSGLPTSRVTLHAVRTESGRHGLLLVNKGAALVANVGLENQTCSTLAAWHLDPVSHEAGLGPVEASASCIAGGVSVDLPRLSVVGVLVD